MFKAQYHLVFWLTALGSAYSCLWVNSLFRPPDTPSVTSISTPPEDASLFTSPAMGAPLIPFLLETPLSTIPPQSLTALLPVLAHTLEQMHETLEPFLNEAPDTLREVIVLCPESIVTAVRRELQRTFSTSTFANHADVSLHPYPWTLSTQTAIDQAIAGVTTGWVLVMDESGLRNVDSAMRKVLLSPPNLTYALGPTGSVLSVYEPLRTQWGTFHPAEYIDPPFVIPSSYEPPKDIGGLLLTPDVPFLGFFLPTLTDLEKLLPLLSRLELPFRVLVSESAGVLDDIPYDSMSFDGWLAQYPMLEVAITIQESDLMTLQSTTLIRIPRSDLEHTDWMSTLSFEEWKNWHTPEIDISIITKDRSASLQRLLRSLTSSLFFGDTLSLRLNIEQDCDTDTLRIVHDFHWPHGAVFAHHRIIHGGLLPAVVESWYPKDNDSYGLLLEDDVELSPLFYAWIKMTVLKYRYGAPSNRIPHMFGISLYQQKHLELLPSGRQPFNPRSLFSQTSSLSSNDLPPYAHKHPTTPYLSQIPCSWGAVYFPEQWREFHDFLAARLAERFPIGGERRWSGNGSKGNDTTSVSTIDYNPNPPLHQFPLYLTIPLSQPLTPLVQSSSSSSPPLLPLRSTTWSRSWKKFYIELVFLRGYVMLYPNFPNFVSLSTNHLEVGSHVRRREGRGSEKRGLFELPLMGLARMKGGMLTEKLPDIEDMPVLNLTGELTTLEGIMERGKVKMDEMGLL